MSDKVENQMSAEEFYEKYYDHFLVVGEPGTFKSTHDRVYRFAEAYAASFRAPTISLSEAAGKVRKTWQEKYGNCTMCDVGDRPEWSPFAKCFIHRHDRLDRRCGNNSTASRAPEGPARTSAIAALEAEWLSQDKILDYRNWLQDKLLQSRAAHARSEGIDTKELAELRAIVGRCEKTSPGVLGGRCDRPKGHRGSHETRNRMTTWLGPNDEPELSERVDGSSECQACRYVEAVIEQHYGRLVSIRKVIEDLEEAQGAKK